MNSDMRAEVTALAINVTIPEVLRWTGREHAVRRRLAAIAAVAWQRET